MWVNPQNLRILFDFQAHLIFEPVYSVIDFLRIEEFNSLMFSKIDDNLRKILKKFNVWNNKTSLLPSLLCPCMFININFTDYMYKFSDVLEIFNYGGQIRKGLLIYCSCRFISYVLVLLDCCVIFISFTKILQWHRFMMIAIMNIIL